MAKKTGARLYLHHSILFLYSRSNWSRFDVINWLKIEFCLFWPFKQLQRTYDTKRISDIKGLQHLVIIHCSWLGTHQRPFCLANWLSIAPKFPSANKMMTASLPYIALGLPTAQIHQWKLAIKLAVTCDSTLFVVCVEKKCILNWPLPIGAFQDQCKQW